MINALPAMIDLKGKKGLVAGIANQHTLRFHRGLGYQAAFLVSDYAQNITGNIGVESEPKKGSRFWFELPFEVAPKSSVSKNTLAPSLPPISKKLRPITSQFEGHILLVDDYPPNQQVAKKILEKMGCTVEIADDGEEALQKLEHATYDIVFMDVQMPEMDGFETTRLLRKNPATEHTVVTAMTANALEGDREKCVAAGMDDYISKPISSAAIGAILKKYLPHAQSSTK